MNSLFLIRTNYGANYTDGVLLLNDNFFCYTLEDRTRKPGDAKIPGETAIPAGKYKVIVNKSARFGKYMPLLLDVPNFEGIRIHGGNKSEDSLGCILVGFKKIKPGHIYNSASNKLTEKIMGQPCTIEIINTGFKYYRGEGA